MQVIQIAALGVWQIVTNKPMKRPLDPVYDPRWEGKTGVFVTLRKNGAVRGSVGMLESSTTLPETLFDASSAAATHDQRFAPVQESEIPELALEVTLLSEVKKIRSPEDILIGETGLIVSRGEKRGVLLPQVAIENRWTREQFLDACCEKAGLKPSAWQEPNTLTEAFTAQVIRHSSLFKTIEEYV